MEDEMCGACSMQERDKKFIQNFGLKAWRKIWKS